MIIEKYIKHDETLKKWRYFKSRRLAVISAWLLIGSCFFSFTAEFWANSKPILLSYKNQIYFPIFKEYSVKEFGIEDTMFIDYRNLTLSASDWVIWPVLDWDPFESNKEVAQYPAPPSGTNLMGTDDRGRDIFVRLLYGLRYSIIYAILCWAITFFVGIIIGGATGYFGGRIDLYAQRVIEVLSTVPQLFLLIILISIFNPNLYLLVGISCLFGWIGISHYVRAEFLKNRKREFVEAARATGCGHTRIFFKHILPNSLSPIFTFSPFAISGFITGLAALDYLGFGLTPPTPSWGELLNQAQANFSIAWWLALFPSLALFITLVLLTFIGEAIKDTMDPRRN
jgi:microcin C transport system permease protein